MEDGQYKWEIAVEYEVASRNSSRIEKLFLATFFIALSIDDC